MLRAKYKMNDYRRRQRRRQHQRHEYANQMKCKSNEMKWNALRYMTSVAVFFFPKKKQKIMYYYTTSAAFLCQCKSLGFDGPRK